MRFGSYAYAFLTLRIVNYGYAFLGLRVYDPRVSHMRLRVAPYAQLYPHRGYGFSVLGIDTLRVLCYDPYMIKATSTARVRRNGARHGQKGETMINLSTVQNLSDADLSAGFCKADREYKAAADRRKMYATTIVARAESNGRIYDGQAADDKGTIRVRTGSFALTVSLDAVSVSLAQDLFTDEQIAQYKALPRQTKRAPRVAARKA